jgi:hypothetical protein
VGDFGQAVDRSIGQALTNDTLVDQLLLNLDSETRMQLAVRGVRPLLLSGRAVLAERRLLHKSDPIYGFVTERLTVKPTAAVDKALLYREFVAYCEETGARAMPLKDFTEVLATSHPSIYPSKRRTGHGPQQVACCRGVRFNDEMAAKVYKVDRTLLGLGCTVPESSEAGRRALAGTA